MATLRQIAQLGNPVLRLKAKTVTSPQSQRVQELIGDLLETVGDVNGMGIAAPQVYDSVRIFVVASSPNPRYPNAPKMTPTPMINPKLLSHAEETLKDWEGCLSIPGIRGLVPRWRWVDVEYTTRKGRRVRQKFTDFVARIFQHELDHLEGIVFLDRLESMRDVITDKEYLKLIDKKKRSTLTKPKSKKRLLVKNLDNVRQSPQTLLR